MADPHAGERDHRLDEDTPPPAEAPPVPAQAARLEAEHEAPVTASRAGRLWVAVIGAIIVLALVLVFILQNLKTTSVQFFSLHWRIPLGIDLLFAAILGGLVVFFIGAVRILQLRRLARRRHRALQRAADEAMEPRQEGAAPRGASRQ